jgi:thiopurine S-methyltransferase
MEHDFWHERWELGQKGWHQDEAHAALVEHWPEFGVPAGATVFVPLCGSSIDMAWLANHGHRVIGTELSDIAIREFFDAVGLSPNERATGGFTVFSAGSYELWCGDHFELGADVLADVTAVYDRASLVALPPDLRRRYADHLGEVLPSGTRSFLVTHVYDQSLMNGPPFSVTGDEVVQLFGDRFDIVKVSDDDVTERNAGLVARGAHRVHEELHHLRRMP